MTAKLWTVGLMIDRITYKLEQSGAANVNRDQVLDDLQEAFDYYVAFGNTVGDSGWVWMLQTVSVALSANSSTVQLTSLEGGIPIAIRLPDSTAYPISLGIGIDPRKFQNWTYNRALAGVPQTAVHASYDPATDLWTIQLWPVQTTATTIDILFQRQSTELLDSYAVADSVYCPAHLRHGLIKGALVHGYEGTDRVGKHQIAIQERDAWLELARVECLRRKPTAQVVVECMADYFAGRSSVPEYWGWA